MSFTLRVIDNEQSGLIMPDSKSDRGGIDFAQIDAFNHLMPDGYCDWMMRERLFGLADLHGWTVRVTRQPKP